MRSGPVVALLAAFAVSCATAAPLLGAYFANWAQYHRSPYTYTPANLQPIVGSLDHINYAFAYFSNETWELTQPEPKDPVFYGEIIAFKKLNPNLKVLLSVGGWNFPSATFSAMVASPSARSAFIQSCMSTMSQYGFDGIDIDWEFPCSPPRKDPIKMTCTWFKDTQDTGGKCPDDPANFLTLLQEMRKAFGTDKIITVASQAAEKHYGQWPLKDMAEAIDYFHLMTYDYTVPDVPEGSMASPNAPLYKPDGSTGATQMSVNDTVMGYMAMGVPPSKMILGLALYGHTWYIPGKTGTEWQQFGLEGEIQGLCCGPFRETYGAQFGYGCQQCGVMMFSEIWAAGPTAFEDATTKSTIGYCATDSADGWTKAGTWITYNSEASYKGLVEYAMKLDLAGVFLFDSSMDTVSDGEFTYTVTKMVAETLAGGSGGGNVCTPPSCNVCSACCKSYLKNQADCNSCVSAECPKTNDCSPSSCNVCSACCKSYLKNQADCNSCVSAECTTPW